jgi:hypothetical protein
VALGPLAREPLGDGDDKDRAIDLGEVPGVVHHLLTSPVRQRIDQRSDQPLLADDQDPLQNGRRQDGAPQQRDPPEKPEAMLALTARLLLAHRRELLRRPALAATDAGRSLSAVRVRPGHV